MISKGSTVRIATPGKYHGQVVTVSTIDGRRMRSKYKRGYKCFVQDREWHWLIPQYFTPDEIEEVQA